MVRRTSPSVRALLCALSPLLLLPSCAMRKSAQLSRVAKDWCLAVRASQVMPVYPLTQDLWPGDVFLTTTPLGSEVDLFESRGFLPLDFHLTRLPTREPMLAFYGERMLTGDAIAQEKGPLGALPAAAFPTYSFEISRALGMNLALPVQGVPFGFSVLGTSAATGTVTLKEARTFGLDLDALQPLLAKWEKEHRALLASYGDSRSGDSAVYVRVVSRVYQARSVVVSISDASGNGAEASTGIEIGEALPGAPDAGMSNAERFVELSRKLDAVAKEAFGGRVSFVSASRRAVALQETFPEPMTIGYLAYDCMVMPGGVLSQPMPTWQRLGGSVPVAAEPWNTAALVESWYLADDARIARIRAWMEQHLAKETRPTTVAFLAEERWDADRRRMIRDLGIALD